MDSSEFNKLSMHIACDARAEGLASKINAFPFMFLELETNN